MSCDCLIIGGGVIGLSLAWELAQAGAKVRLLERGQPGQEASWAGAGMLPPGSRLPNANTYEQLQGLSMELHPRWSDRLRELTGLDNGFRRGGAVYLGRPNAADASLPEAVANWTRLGIRHEPLSPEALSRIEPALARESIRPDGESPSAYYLPDECQLRNPRHLKALQAACAKAGVETSPGREVDDFQLKGNRIHKVFAGGETLTADRVCVCTGSWSSQLVRKLGATIQVRPVRGQIALLNDAQVRLTRIVNEGPRYLVPRGDGLVLVGSTEEEAGYDRGTTATGIAALLEFALSLAPSLASASLKRSWAGLRPATSDGWPYLGRIPHVENAFVAAGHFRAGLCLSPGTAVLMRQLMLGDRPELDISALRLDRHLTNQ